jgi:hypothetical protein
LQIATLNACIVESARGNDDVTGFVERGGVAELFQLLITSFITASARCSAVFRGASVRENLLGAVIAKSSTLGLFWRSDMAENVILVVQEFNIFVMVFYVVVLWLRGSLSARCAIPNQSPRAATLVAKTA